MYCLRLNKSGKFIRTVGTLHETGLDQLTLVKMERSNHYVKAEANRVSNWSIKRMITFDS